MAHDGTDFGVSYFLCGNELGCKMCKPVMVIQLVTAPMATKQYLFYIRSVIMLTVKPLSDLGKELKPKIESKVKQDEIDRVEKFNIMLSKLLSVFEESYVDTGSVTSATALFTVYLNNAAVTPAYAITCEVYKTFKTVLEGADSVLFLNYANSKLKDTGYSIAITRTYYEWWYDESEDKSIDMVTVILKKSTAMESYIESRYCDSTHTNLVFRCGEDLKTFHELSNNWRCLTSNVIFGYYYSMQCFSPESIRCTTQLMYDFSTFEEQPKHREPVSIAWIYWAIIIFFIIVCSTLVVLF
jgi:hypothetical protein